MIRWLRTHLPAHCRRLAGSQGDRSRRTRLVIIIGFWVLVLVGSRAFLTVSNRQISNRLASVEAKATTITVSDNDIASAMFASDPAELGSERSVSFRAPDPGPLAPPLTSGAWGHRQQQLLDALQAWDV